MKELSLALLVIGCRETDIAVAFRKAGGWDPSEGPFPSFMSHRHWAEKVEPQVQAALAGKQEVPPQPSYTEAWLAFALFLGESLLSLEEVIETADFINHLTPIPEEIAWAFLRLRRREWLAMEGNSYGLTAEGRRTIEGIVDEGGVVENSERLSEWLLAHPP